MSAEQIVKILADQHTKDVFVTECKDGPTWGGSHARMDVWTMTRSWSNLLFTGYEVKVSRSDFKQDNKWHSYLPLCNQLYFVCPKGMIEASEMPDGVGLKYCTESRATVVKKAAHRECEPPMELFCYLLMARSRIVSPHHYEPETAASKIERFKNWLADKSESRRVGHIVGGQLAQHIDRVQAENQRVKEEMGRLNKIAGFARELGINQWTTNDRIKERLKEFTAAVPEDYKSNLRAIHAETDRLIKLFDGEVK